MEHAGIQSPITTVATPPNTIAGILGCVINNENCSKQMSLIKGLFDISVNNHHLSLYILRRTQSLPLTTPKMETVSGTDIFGCTCTCTRYTQSSHPTHVKNVLNWYCNIRLNLFNGK